MGDERRLYGPEPGRRLERARCVCDGVCDKQTRGRDHDRRGKRDTTLLSGIRSFSRSTRDRAWNHDLSNPLPEDRRERCACVCACVRGCAQAAGQRPGAAEVEMGSTDKAVITGFICRLCSKMNRFVIHIYGEEGERMKLAEKINTYLPITVIHYAAGKFHSSSSAPSIPISRASPAMEMPERET